MNNQSFFKTVLSHAPKYLTGSVIAAGTSLLMTKYYTTIFTPADFGILALYLVMFQYVMTFSSLNLDASSTRFYFDYRDTNRDEYLSTIFWLISFISLVVLIICLFFMDFISNWISPGSQNIYFITIITGIVAVYVSFLTRILYNEHKSTSVLKHTVFQTFVNHFSSILLISWFNLGILGRMSGQGLGYGVNTITLIKEFTKENLFKLKMTFNKDMAKETFVLSIPSMVAAIQSIVFVYIDRIFLKHYIGDTAVGIYTLGYMLGQGLSMVYDAISQAILPKVFSGMNENYDKTRDELEHFAYSYYLGLIIITFIISLLSPFIVSVFSNDNYSHAAMVMPFVMAGFMMGGFYKIPSLVLGYHKVVWIYLWLPAVSFGTNVLLNWLLIPIYGIVGAAFASFIGLFLYSSILQAFSFRYMSKKYNLFIIICYLFLFAFLTIAFLLGDK